MKEQQAVRSYTFWLVLSAWMLGLGVVGLVVGALIGGTIGGNYATNFWFVGGPGYEGTTALGSFIGFCFGLAIGIYTKSKRIATPLLVGVMLCIAILILTRFPQLSVLMMMAIIFGLAMLFEFLISRMRWSSKMWTISLLILNCALVVVLGYSYGYNYACVNNANLCLFQPISVSLKVKGKLPDLKLISDIDIYGEAYTLKQYCDNMDLEWNFGDGEMETQSVCQPSPPNTFVETRSWIKHNYVNDQSSDATVRLLFNGNELATSSK